MLRIVDGIQDVPRLLLSTALISGIFRPVLHYGPILSENRIQLRFLRKGLPKTGNV